jgi:hypothetical protein
MKPTNTPELEWAGIDLHVHTPASYDYEGLRDDSEYLTLIKRANEFGIGASKRDSTGRKHLISCVAFTDHNSVEGFCRWKRIVEDTGSLAAAIRNRDPNNELLKNLESDLDTLRAVRVLMGVEISANPGVHLLLIFHESIQPDNVREFLTQLYAKSYTTFAGTTGLISHSSLEQTLDMIHSTFGEHVIVIAPHVENSGGIYEALKELGHLRMLALKHQALTALSFNKPETRDRLRGLLQQGDYKRESPLVFIQSSDAHGKRGRIGQPRTDVLVRNGRPTFSNIREAFRHNNRVKCSIDFVEEEYRNLTADEQIFKFKATTSFSFNEEDHQELATTVCAILNSRTGVIELEGTMVADEPKLRERVETELENLLDSKLLPNPHIVLAMEFKFSSTRIRVLFKPVPMVRLSTCSGVVYVIDKSAVRYATSTEIESIVASLMERRFGNRFTKALEDISSRSILLSKMPTAMPLLLRCRDQFDFMDKDDLKLTKIESAKGDDRDDGFTDFYNDLLDKFQFGTSTGSTIIIPDDPTPPREHEHYVRYLPYRFDCAPKEHQRFGATTLQSPSILIRPGGCSHFCEPGSVIAETTIFSIAPDPKPDILIGLIAWFKSSFFIWYSAVYMGSFDLYQHLQDGNFRFPIPKLDQTKLYARLSMLANNILLEERRFLQELQKEQQKGADSSYRDKLRIRHNSSSNIISLAIDDEIYDFLNLDDDDREFIAQTVVDLKMSDFGFLERLNKNPPSRS